MPRDIEGYTAQSSHFPTQRRTRRDAAIVNTLETGERREYRPADRRFFEARLLWEAIKRAEKRGAEESAASGVSAEAAKDASGGGSSWSGDGRWGWARAGDKGKWAGSSWGDKKQRAWWDDNRHTDR